MKLFPVVAGIALAVAGITRAADSGETRILKWKDGKEAVFLLAFDDSCPTHLDKAIPELAKRGLVGNFYVNPGKGAFPPRSAEWKKAARSPVVALQNHTFTHKGATTAPELDEELARCNDALKDFFPDPKWPRLIAFGKPGGVPWEVPADQVDQLLAKHHLFHRPMFHGPPFHQKSVAECLATIDQALADGTMGHIDFHGVGGDWHVTPMDWYLAILDRLVEKKDRLWIADNVHYHQYLTERESAAAKVIKASGDGIQLSLTCQADPALYDFPLTLETSVPGGWEQCQIEQGGKVTTAPVTNGVVRYEARPGPETIHLKRK
ncbi:polysaccharide deacetylase family protein [Luteolibacter marinus]|uniref:polysaccharide deacetylase family protein n=1 Tax=Luteolibacter marinus TaxID=2776705 RepID=UPI001868BFE4|nr:polysaccharide deacetylase family protein [Luteolibacter marinus]